MNNTIGMFVFWTGVLTVWGIILVSIWLRPVP